MNWSQHLAVCSWSLQPENPEELVRHLRTIGIPRVQIALEPFRTQPQVWESFPELCARYGIEIVSGMLATKDEDYTTMESIQRTGGIVPDETWEENWNNARQIAKIAAGLNIRLVTFHAGFLPDDQGDAGFKKLLSRLRQVADIFADRNIMLGLETGQELAATLDEFLHVLERKNVGVNFDPANMILYDQGDPIAALRKLQPWLQQCHIKDARRTQRPGTWGDEVVVGTGEVDWKQFFDVLDQIRFSGDCCIEREAGDSRVADIRAAREYVERLQ